MKNTKLIALVALLVVISMVVSVVIATSNDNKVSGQVQETVKSYEEKIADLNKTIDKLNAGLISANQALEALKNAGVELENWNAASAVLADKLDELEAAAEAFEESANVYAPDHDECTLEDHEACVVADFYDVYSYSYNDVDSMEVFYELAYKAQTDILRATSVAEMDAIIAQFKKDCEAVPTILETLYATLKTIGTEVTYDDYDNIKKASFLFSVVDEDVLAPAATEDDKSEKELLDEQLKALYVDFKPLVVDTFITLVGKLPSVEQYAPSYEDELVAAQEEYAFVLELYGEDVKDLRKDKKDKETAFAKAEVTLGEIKAQKVVVDGIVEAAELVNEAIKAQKDYKIAADRASRLMIEGLEALVAEWEEDYSIITDEKDEDFNAELYNLVNRAGIEAYNNTLLAKAGELKVLADAYIAIIDGIEKVTNTSKDTLDASLDAWDEFTTAAGALTPVDVDFIVGYESEEGVVAAWNNYTAKLTVYNNIIAAIDYVENGVKAVMKVDCKVNHGKNEDDEPIACDCEVNVLDETKLTSLDQTGIDAKLVALLATYELDETVIDADLLAIYKTARLYDELAAALANVDTAYAAATNASKDAQKASLVTLVERAAKKAYTFEVELVCTCDPDSEEECECDTYKLVDDAATKALAVFTKEYCDGFFAEVVVEEEEA